MFGSRIEGLPSNTAERVQGVDLRVKGMVSYLDSTVEEAGSGVRRSKEAYLKFKVGLAGIKGIVNQS